MNWKINKPTVVFPKLYTYIEPYEQKRTFIFTIPVGSRNEKGWLHHYFIVRYRKIGDSDWTTTIGIVYENRFTDMDQIDIAPIDAEEENEAYEVQIWHINIVKD